MADFDFSAHRVVLCDIDPESIDIARTTYLENGIGDFVATPSPTEAVKRVLALKPDIILVALKLLDINGIEVVRQIRALNDGEFYKTPILLLLEKVSQHMLREACRAGIEGALRKPLSPEKLLRFTRAVVLKPRRFICVAHYFGPERRMRDDPHFSGEDRRSSLSKEDFDLDQYTRARSNGGHSTIVPGKSSLDSSPVLSGGKNGNKPANDESFDWWQSTTRSTDKEAAFEFGETRNTNSGDTKNGHGDYALTDSPNAGTKKSAEDFDFTSQTKEDAKTTLVSSPEKNAAQKADPSLTSRTDPQDTAKNEPAAKVQEDPAKPVKEVQKTGPDSDDFEEILDLDECLELHKEWINSGGKSGLQARRPHSDFRGQEIADADFTHAQLPQSNFEGVNASGTIFRKADLSGSTFRTALLSSADLRVARLSKSDMREARMDRANLLGADLSGANLEGATLRGVNLSGANLHLTNLRGVNLLNTQGLIREQVRRAITDSTTLLPPSLNMAP